MKNTRTKIQLLILAVTVILSIVAFMYLPDVAAVQWNSAGATNYLPKIWAVVIPPVSSLIAIIFWNGYSDFYNAKWRRIYERASAGYDDRSSKRCHFLRSCSVRENPAACKKKRDTDAFRKRGSKNTKATFECCP